MSNADQKRDPIHGCIERWHAHMRRELDGGLDAILHPDVVFLSPIVFTPQQGIDITKLYLSAAGGTLGGESGSSGESGESSGSSGGGFRYTKEILDGHHAVLEFETSIEGKYVNGIDMMTCDDDGMIVEFKVLIRPLQAINLVHAQMGKMLDKLSS